MVAAAFIGPGTLTTAATTGASSGLALAWTILFALIATVTLQELAVRSALATQRDLAPLAREFGGAIWGRWLVAPLIVAAIGVGNADEPGCSTTARGAIECNRLTKAAELA